MFGEPSSLESMAMPLPLAKEQRDHSFTAIAHEQGKIDWQD